MSDDLRRALSEAVAERDRLRAEAEAKAQEVKVLERALGELDRLRADSRLHNSHKRARINRNMDAAQPARPTRGQPLKTKHVFPLRAREVDGSLSATARKLGVSNAWARSWYLDGELGREIPEKYADILAAEPYKIPRSAWKNGIRKDS